MSEASLGVITRLVAAAKVMGSATSVQGLEKVVVEQRLLVLSPTLTPDAIQAPMVEALFDDLVEHVRAGRLLRDSLESALEQKTAELIQNDLSLKMLNHSLTEKTEQMQKLFTIIAHDLRGPIGTAKNLAFLASEQPLGSGQSELGLVLPELAKVLGTSFDLLENLLAWVRGQIDGPPGARGDAIPGPFLLVDALGEVSEWIGPQARAKGISLVVTCPATLEPRADRPVVQTIARNLLSNAVKFSPRGGIVHLRGLASEGHGTLNSCAIEVEDRGCGMASDQILMLFQSSRGSHTKGTEGEPGSGLGLQFSQELAQRIRGRIEVESPPGQGSTFRFFF